MKSKITTLHTFVICAYGESPYLEDCLVSLKNQEYASQLLLYTSTPNVLIDNLAAKYHIHVIPENEMPGHEVGMLGMLLVASIKEISIILKNR